MTLAAKAAFEAWKSSLPESPDEPIVRRRTLCPYQETPASIFAAGWDARGGYAITRAQQLADAGKELAAACKATLVRLGFSAPRSRHIEYDTVRGLMRAALKRWEGIANG